MKRFKDFVNEKNSDNIFSFEKFINDVKDAVKKDFSSTDDYAEEFVKQYEEQLIDAWRKGFTVREAIASTRVDGVKVSDDKVDESVEYVIDELYEESVIKIKNIKGINNLIEGEMVLHKYFTTFNKKNISDVRAFEKIKNNYNLLIDLYNEKCKQLKK